MVIGSILNDLICVFMILIGVMRSIVWSEQLFMYPFLEILECVVLSVQ